MRIFTTVLLAALLFGSCGKKDSGGGSGGDPRETERPEQARYKSALEILETRPEFSTLLRIVRKHNLGEVFEFEDEVTLILPTNEAYDNLERGALGLMLIDEQYGRVVVENLVIKSKISEEELSRKKEIENINGFVYEVKKDGDKVNLGNRGVIVYPDIQFEGGVAHGISGVFGI